MVSPAGSDIAGETSPATAQPFHSIKANVPTTRNSINPAAVILTVQSTTSDTYCQTVFMAEE
jgi:hypothetical protein